jgi:acetyl-CoA acetyltransferase
MLGLRPSRAASTGLQHGPRRRRARRLDGPQVPGTTVNRYCSSSVQTTRMAFHAIKAGEGDVFISAGVECVSQYGKFAKGTADHGPGHPEPALRRPRARTEERAKAWPVTGPTPARTASSPTSTSPMGQTAENVATRSAAASAASVRTSGASRSQNRAEAAINSGFWANDITPVTCPTARSCPPTTARARHHPTRRLWAQAGLPPRRHRHRRQLLPAQRRRRRRRRDERHQGQGARPHAAGPDRVDRPCPASRPRSWASARSRPPARR